VGACGVVLLAVCQDYLKAGVEGLLDRVLHRQFNKVDLVWVASDCPAAEGTPKVGLGGCSPAEQRDLGWLTTQVRAFAGAGLRGFDGLPQNFTLGTKDFNSVQNNVLYVATPATDAELALITIGYDREQNQKDGCLRLYSSTKPPMRISPVLCLDRGGRWWSKDADADTLVRLSKVTQVSMAGMP
jgi:hypothetical protein